MSDMNNDTNKADKKRGFKRPNPLKLVLIFVIICIICSFVCNILLYRRIVKLQKEIDSLSLYSHNIEIVI